MAEKKAEAEADIIGSARMLDDGTVVLELRAEDSDGVSGHGQLRYPPSHKDYRMVLDHVGGLRPGEQKPVPPFP